LDVRQTIYTFAEHAKDLLVLLRSPQGKALSRGDLDTGALLPQRDWSGDSRRIDLSQQLTATLEALQFDRQLDAATHDQDAASPWVFCDHQGKPFHQNWVRLRFFRLLKGAGVRQVRFHDLRHTFASLLLQNGENPVYVKEQMGHCSIQVTVDVYGHLIPGGNKHAGRPSGCRCRRTVVEARICNPGATGPRFPGSHLIGSAAFSSSYEEGGWGG
jgi:integrase